MSGIVIRRFVNEEERRKFWTEEVGPLPKMPEPHKCTKRLHNYSFHIKCTCGAEASVESWYWNTFKYCPGCGTTCEEVIE